MNINGVTVSHIVATVTALGLFLNVIVHWDKIKPVLFSRISFFIVEYALMFGCCHFGLWAILVGSNVYLLLVTFDFVRNGDNSCAAIASAILAAAMGVLNFAFQFALVVIGK